MLTNGQKKSLHSAARQCGFDDDARRLVQRNIGGFFSAADTTCTREGFIAVMAFYEDRAGGCLAGQTPGYWRAENDRANPLDTVLHRIHQEQAHLAMTDLQLDEFIRGQHMTDGKFNALGECPAYWLRRILQALIAIRQRKQRTA